MKLLFISNVPGSRQRPYAMKWRSVMSKITSVIDRQKAYVSRLEASNFKYGLTVGAAFVRGIRR